MNTIKLLSGVCIFFLFAGSTSSCKKSSVDPYAAYTPEREAKLIAQWKSSSKAAKVQLDSTSTGIYYIIDKTKTGTGPTVKAGDKVTVKYTGMFLDGTIFDSSSSHGNGTMTYVHKTDRLIQGWEEGIEVLNKGASAAFLIPSAKGYGASGSLPIIPPYSPLIFIIEVIDIK